MIELYLKKNPNELAEVAYPDGLIDQNCLYRFIDLLCGRARGNCDTCNICEEESKRMNIYEWREYEDMFVTPEFYAGEFDIDKVNEAIDRVYEDWFYDIKIFIRMEEI